jgi:hypothetical protein
MKKTKAVKPNVASGKFLLRLPRELHRDLALQAKEEGVSLNQLVALLLAQYIGRLEGVAIAQTAMRAALGFEINESKPSIES